MTHDLRPDIAIPSDLPALAILEAKAFSHPDYADARLSRRQYRYLLGRPSVDIPVLRDSLGEIRAAAVVLYRKNSSRARLYSLAVDPFLQGRGAGTRLMEHAEKTAEARGCTVMGLEMRAEDTKLKSFYTKLHYEVIRCVPCYYNRSGAALILQKTLPTGPRTIQGRDR